MATDPQVSGEMWLIRDYLPEVRALDLEIFPPLERLMSWLDRPAEVEVLPVRRDSPDHNLLSFWAHPERALDGDARAATSGFARQPPVVIDRVVRTLERDLTSGAWDARYGTLRHIDALDAGLRLVRARSNIRGR